MDPASARRHFLLIAVGTLVLDLGVAGWLLFGPIDLPQEQRWLVAGAVVASGAMGLYLLRRIWQRNFGV